MKRLAILFFSLLLLASCSGKKYDVYLLIGQSNMAGRGTLLESDFAAGPEEGVFLLDSLDMPVPATHPYNQYSTIRKDIGMQQMSPAYSFGKEMRRYGRRPVLLVVNARGGTALDEWMPGTDYLNEAVRRTEEAMKYGKLRGIVWHQGCTDADLGRLSDYMDRLVVMVAALRGALDAEEKPFIAGEVARWNPYSDEFRAQMGAMEERIPHSACVSSEGLGMLKDESDPHFSREAQLLLGERYAEKMSEMLFHRK